MSLSEIFDTTFDTTLKNLQPGADVLQAPIAQMLLALAQAISEGQIALDQNSIKSAMLLGSSTVDLKDKDGQTISRSLLELGFSPQFYHFSEANLTVNVTLAFKAEESYDVKFGLDPARAAGAKAGTGGAGSASLVKLTVKEGVSVGAKLDFKGTGVTESLSFVPALEESKIALADSNEAQAQAIANAVARHSTLKTKIKAAVSSSDKTKVDFSTVDPAAPATTLATSVPDTVLVVKIGDSVTVKDFKLLKSGDTLTVESTTLTFAAAPAKGTIPIAGNTADQAKAILAAVQGSAALKDKVTAKVDSATVTLELGKDVKDEITVTTSGTGLELVGSKLAPAPASGGGAPASPPSGTAGAAVGDFLSNIGRGLAALGVSVSVEYHRKYNFDTSTTNKVEAKLVSLPAPTPFLDAIRAHFGL
jgi:hypothetical protein